MLKILMLKRQLDAKRSELKALEERMLNFRPGRRSWRRPSAR